MLKLVVISHGHPLRMLIRGTLFNFKLLSFKKSYSSWHGLFLLFNLWLEVFRLERGSRHWT